MSDLLKSYNKYAGENKSLIRKALTSVTGSGEALIPQHLEQIITNSVPRLSPTLAMVTPKFDNMKYFEYNRLTALPANGGAMGESATTPTTQPSFTRTGVYMKVIRRKGATTNFLKDASKKMYDAVATNIEATLLAHIYDMENYIMYGNATANPYEFDGLDTLIVTNRVNQAVGGAVPASLSVLDDLIDRNLDQQGYDHKKAFVMSPQMLSKFSQLLTNVRLNQGMAGDGKVNVDGGWRLDAYRDIPIIVSNAIRPRTAMGTVTPTNAQTGGTITDATTRYGMVAAITKNGEQLASAEITMVSGSSANTNTMILTFTPIADAFKYKVYIGTASGGAKTLKAVVPAFAYDANGTPSASTTYTVVASNCTVTSNASGVVNVITFLSDPNVANATVPSGLQSDVPLTGTIGSSVPESIYLWDLDEYQGMGALGYTNEGGARFNGLVTIEDLAVTDDFLPFMIKSYCALIPAYEATSSVVRGYRAV